MDVGVELSSFLQLSVFSDHVFEFLVEIMQSLLDVVNMLRFIFFGVTNRLVGSMLGIFPQELIFLLEVIDEFVLENPDGIIVLLVLGENRAGVASSIS